jgi:hypothetical protein
VNVDDTHGRLRFAALAREAFSFLSEIGFEVVRAEPTLVRWEGHDVFVTCYHGRASYQVGLELGRLDREERFSLHEVLTAVAPQEVKKARYQAVEPAVLARCLNDIADTVRTHAAGLLAGERSAFESLQAATSAARRSATLWAQFGAVIDEADLAWQGGDRGRAADLYESAAPALDNARRRRVNYVRHKEDAG